MQNHLIFRLFVPKAKVLFFTDYFLPIQNVNMVCLSEIACNQTHTHMHTCKLNLSTSNLFYIVSRMFGLKGISCRVGTLRQKTLLVQFNSKE